MPIEIVQSNDPRAATLIAEGWIETARSFGAALDPSHIDPARLEELALAAPSSIEIRELGDGDVAAIMELDRTTIPDYPGREATAHAPLDMAHAHPTSEHPAFGAFAADGTLVGMTFVDVAGDLADTDFTVVALEYRGQGIATALKARSIATLIGRGIR